MRPLLLTAAIVVVLPHLARADCIAAPEGISARDAVAFSDIVFSGTVIKIEDPHAPGLTQIVTFEVNRVWKGPTIQQQVIHHSVNTETRVFAVGESLVVFGKQLDADSRRGSGFREPDRLHSVTRGLPAAPITQSGSTASFRSSPR
jgi:hypothetical protein